MVCHPAKRAGEEIEPDVEAATTASNEEQGEQGQG